MSYDRYFPPRPKPGCESNVVIRDGVLVQDLAEAIGMDPSNCFKWLRKACEPLNVVAGWRPSHGQYARAVTPADADRLVEERIKLGH
jgi:hypothetical protein